MNYVFIYRDFPVWPERNKPFAAVPTNHVAMRPVAWNEIAYQPDSLAKWNTLNGRSYLPMIKTDVFESLLILSIKFYAF